jgi:hypothetical protein
VASFSMIGHGPLDPAEVGAVHLGIMGQLLLRDLPLVPEAAEIRREKLAQVHVPSQPTCGLSAHGFKASNEAEGKTCYGI